VKIAAADAVVGELAGAPGKLDVEPPAPAAVGGELEDVEPPGPAAVGG